jgi:pilus assembly protein CpaB
MRWAIVVLVGLGILAALSMSLLVNALRSEKRAELSGKGEVSAVVATKSLPAMSWLTSENITVKKVPRKGLSPDYLSNPISVYGKVLIVPVVENQVINRNFLISEGSGAQLASKLQPGMRAVSVPVSKHSVMGGLLYPGCLVDVIATFRLGYEETKGQAISTTLLHGVQVLAVQSESIVSKSDEEEKKPKTTAITRTESLLTVTLMVDNRQAEALQLAMNQGKITLAMRNPLDQKSVEAEPMVLSEGKMARLGQLLAPSVFAQGQGDANSIHDPNRSFDPSRIAEEQNAEQLRRLFGEGGKSAQWEVTVIRGRDVKDEVVELTAEGMTEQVVESK